MPVLVPALERQWLWEPMLESTDVGTAIAEWVAVEPLSSLDLFAIASAATLRVRFSWMQPDAANARVIQLEEQLATMKLRLHQAEMDREEARAELVVCRSSLFDERTAKEEGRP